MIEIIRFIFLLAVIVIFAADMVVRWQYKKELKKLLKQIKK